MLSTSKPSWAAAPRVMAGLLLFVASAATAASTAVPGVREAAIGLERQFKIDNAAGATQAFRLPLSGSSVVLGGEARLESIPHNRCRRTLELVHDRPFERRGLRITNLSRRSVQEGPCQNFADAMAAQAEASAHSIAEQIGVAEAKPDLIPGERLLVAQAGPGAPKLRESTVTPPKPVATANRTGAAVSLTVLKKAIIRDAPTTEGEKLSRADAGTRLKAQRLVGNPEWFVLDGGLRFISASVVDVSDAATASAPARGDQSRVRVKVIERAVVRNAPSFRGQKVASLAAGVERLARKVPGMQGWLQLADSDSRYPLYIHESVVAEKAGDKRL